MAKANSLGLIVRTDPLARLLLADIVEGTGAAIRYWNLTVEFAHTDPDAAFSRLTDMDIALRQDQRDLRTLRRRIDRILSAMDLEGDEFDGSAASRGQSS